MSPGDAPRYETSIAPWLAVHDAHAAVDFYAAAFGATELYRLEGDNGTLEVAQLAVDGATFWVQHDADPDPNARRPGSVRFILSVEDPEAGFARAVEAGATVVAPVSEGHGWRTGRVTDPFGYDWEISRQLAAT